MRRSSSGAGYPMRRRRRNRSSWDSGRGKVPSNSWGFWVAMTTKGRGRAWVVPSTETCPSPMDSRRAAWVRGVARLISSARTTLEKTGPGRNSKVEVRASKTDAPTTSVGRRSGVNWMRAKVPPRVRARARARVVFPTPGTSSTRRWPPERTPTSTCRTVAGFPTKTPSMEARTAARRGSGVPGEFLASLTPAKVNPPRAPSPSPRRGCRRCGPRSGCRRCPRARPRG